MNCSGKLTYPQCPYPTQGNITEYLNQEWIKKALDVPLSFSFHESNRYMWDGYSASCALWKPTTRELIDVLDAYIEPDLADIRVMVLNGNLDFLVNTPGNKWQYDRLRWSEQAEYSIKKWRTLPEGLGATGLWKATRSGRLAFISVDDAGHFVPGDVREGSYKIVLEWLHGGWRT